METLKTTQMDADPAGLQEVPETAPFVNLIQGNGDNHLHKASFSIASFIYTLDFPWVVQGEMELSTVMNALTGILEPIHHGKFKLFQE